MWFYIIFVSAPISLICNFGRKNIVNCLSRLNTKFDAKQKSDMAHCKNKNMWFYIIFESAPFSLIGTFGGREHFKLCE